MRESDGPNSNVVGEKLCKHKYSSYPYCYGEIASETQGNRYFLYQIKYMKYCIKFQSYHFAQKRVAHYVSIFILTAY